MPTAYASHLAFWSDLLLSGRIHVIFGTGRLTGNESCTQPKVRALSCFIFIIDINMRIRISSLRTMLPLAMNDLPLKGCDDQWHRWCHWSSLDAGHPKWPFIRLSDDQIRLAARLSRSTPVCLSQEADKRQSMGQLQPAIGMVSCVERYAYDRSA